MNTIEFTKHQEWLASYKGVAIKIVCSETNLAGFNNEAWCYYIFIYEHNCPKFSELWLPAKVEPYYPGGKDCVSYDYYSAIYVHDADWHGGITFYAKHGEVPGHRTVEFGCDYLHLHDEGGHSLEELKTDAINTADQLIASFGITNL